MFRFLIENEQDAFDFLCGLYPEETVNSLKPDRQLFLARVEASGANDVVKAALRAREFGDTQSAEKIRASAPHLFTPEAMVRYFSKPLLGQRQAELDEGFFPGSFNAQPAAAAYH